MSIVYVIFSMTLSNFSNLYSQTLTPHYITTTAQSNGYYEYLPQGYDRTSNKKYPLLFCFGGYGENGDGSTIELHYVLEPYGSTGWLMEKGIFPTSFMVNGQAQQFIILFPQFTGVATQQTINDVIDYAILHYQIDVTRIYLTGISLGGGLLWDYTGYSLANANRIAAMVPVSGGSYADTMKAQNIAAGNIAVWATHNDQDPTVPIDTTTIGYVNLINASMPPPSPLAKITIFHDDQHNAWDSTYNPFYGLHVYEWMLQFKRGPATLPVTGLELNVIKNADDNVLLKWKTYTESNNRGFAVERSVDGIRFDSIGFTNTHSNAGTGAEYTFTDEMPLDGKNFYRLKQISFDSKFTYSPVKIIEFNNIISVKIFPNPANDVFHLRINMSVQNALLKIINAKGQLVKQIIITSGNSTIPIKNLSPGIYSGEILHNAGTIKFHFVKH